MAKLAPRTVKVLAINDITLNMRRITLGGASLADFPPAQQGGYIKLMFENPGQDRPSVRTYTIRHQREELNEIDVDFVMHGDCGMASSWALHTMLGEVITFGGPGPKAQVDFDADWFFMVADMTALPALSVNLEALPESAKGYAIVEVLDESDIQEISAPSGIEMHWLVVDEKHSSGETVVNRVRNRAWLPGRPFVWAASEFDTMRALRQYFKKDRQLPKSDIYISSYWKRGLQEDEHKIVKKQDAELGWPGGNSAKRWN